MRYERYTHKRQYKRYERHTADVIPPLAFTTNLPKSKSATVGEAVTLKVIVKDGVEPYSYQWKKGNQVLSEKSAILTIASATEADSATYTCTVTDKAGQTITSNGCVLAVAAAPAA